MKLKWDFSTMKSFGLINKQCDTSNTPYVLSIVLKEYSNRKIISITNTNCSHHPSPRSIYKYMLGSTSSKLISPPIVCWLNNDIHHQEHCFLGKFIERATDYSTPTCFLYSNPHPSKANITSQRFIILHNL